MTGQPSKPRCTACGELRRLLGDLTASVAGLTSRLGQLESTFDMLIQVVESQDAQLARFESGLAGRDNESKLGGPMRRFDQRLGRLLARVRLLESEGLDCGPWTHGNM